MIEPDQCSSMAEVRAGLDALDQEIVGLLAKRFRYVDAAARIKQRRDQIRDQGRIAIVIDQVRSKALDVGAPAELIGKFYETLVEASVQYELEKFDAGAS